MCTTTADRSKREVWTVGSFTGSGFVGRRRASLGVTKDIWKNEVQHTEKIIVDYFNRETKNAAQVDEIIINLESSDSEDEEEEEVLATPLEPVAGSSKSN
ncbi:hypothetical protein C0J52_27089 [Blattella germanica]|nr:hypothetical protein C0J52_27089 [Blattella germanica]